MNDISMRVRPGTATALIGRNGSGKSTLLSILAGLVRLSSGVLTTGRPGLTTGYAPEAFPALKLTAEDYLRGMGRIAGLCEAAGRSRVSELLATFGLDSFRSRKLAGFSKGMLQKVNLIQSLLIRPQLLLLDEPMSGLDLPAQHTLLDLLQELKREGTALVFSVHEPQIIEAMADDLYVLQEGQMLRTIHGAENLRSAPAVYIVYTELHPVAQQAVKAVPGVRTMQPAPDLSGISCTGLTVDQKMSDTCLQQILAAGGSIVSVKPLGGLGDLTEWMDPKDQIGSGRG
ncbi:ABC transporter ATP-binding protein [Paenibacillus tritici]|uniref:ABC transporter ATP-binding protein n=1 Tax=Paenibacillus tritici TaxID=1873425 RepID=A0ABX2DNX6_9BACL|nr:ABC transporter ATP-binding protein [Paenibacillus tritici]NQX46320.1 ABC transporter ATP-binding protein [Paenibacillus tritici]QUL52503.1 ABC transporter ATP-binding protein [Paenibacillus tritici]